jgi:hypothetical protein
MQSANPPTVGYVLELEDYKTLEYVQKEHWAIKTKDLVHAQNR